MLRLLIGVYLALHGLVHLWYVALSRGLVAFKPEMGWSGKSWIFTNLLGQAVTLPLATLCFTVATITFLAGGIGVLFRADWWRPVVIASAILSSMVILLFWDGGGERIVEKGLLGLLINAIILVALLVFKWPSGGL